MTELYGSNLGNLVLRGSNHSHRDDVANHWWCSACEKLIVQVLDPIDCPDCGADTTYAPRSAPRRIK